MNVIEKCIIDGSRWVSLEDLDALMVALPLVRDSLEDRARDEAGLVDQFRFLRHVAEDVAAGLRRELPLSTVAEILFALTYLTRGNDIIPDALHHEGLIDDKAVLTSVLVRNEKALRDLAESRGHDWEMLTTVI